MPKVSRVMESFFILYVIVSSEVHFFFALSVNFGLLPTYTNYKLIKLVISYQPINIKFLEMNAWTLISFS